jgi:hypothetical protein
MQRLAAATTSAAGPAADPLMAKRFFFGGLAIGVIVMSMVGLATAVFIESPHDVAARSAAPPATTLTAEARWQVLREAITVQGIVRSARKITVTGRAPYGTVTLTQIPVRPGDRVRPGHVIAGIDGRPVILLRGRLPAYRDLHEGDHGPDVAQLQRALQGLGYADFDPPGYFRQSTALALVVFYRHLGYDAPVYPRLRRARAQAGPAVRGIASTPDATKLVIPSAYLPRSEVVFIPAASALVASVAARVGDLVRNSAMLTLATGKPYVSAVLSQHQAAQARRGMPAQIVAGNPQLTVRGTVTRIGHLPLGGGPRAGGYPVLVRPRRALPQRMIGASVRLTLRAPVTSAPVLTVPVNAILATRHGRSAYVVKVTASGRRVRVAIFAGPTADGLVAVQSVRRGQLRPGDLVLIGVSQWPPSH